MNSVLDQEWIMEQWEKNYYISSIAGANNGSSLVVMSKGIYIFPAFMNTFKCFLYEWYFTSLGICGLFDVWF